MKLHSILILAVATTSMVVAACHSSRSLNTGSNDMTQDTVTESPILSAPTPSHPAPAIQGGSPQNALPRATIYKTNGYYSRNVAITVDPSTDVIVYYPAPSDITSESAPIQLLDGWLLARQASAGEGTRFLKYTYEEYQNLKSTPTLAELREAIIPDARVISSRRLPITLQEALADPTALTEYLPKL